MKIPFVRAWTRHFHGSRPWATAVACIVMAMRIAMPTLLIGAIWHLISLLGFDAMYGKGAVMSDQRGVIAGRFFLFTVFSITTIAGYGPLMRWLAIWEHEPAVKVLLTQFIGSNDIPSTIAPAVVSIINVCRRGTTGWIGEDQSSYFRYLVTSADWVEVKSHLISTGLAGNHPAAEETIDKVTKQFVANGELPISLR